MSKFKFLNQTLTAAVAALLILPVVASAADDSCEDYFMRHHKKDLAPTGITVSEVPRSGDISGYQAIVVKVKNVGNQTIVTNVAPGMISSARAITIGVRYTGANNRPEFRYYKGSLNMPMRPGQTNTVLISLPSKTIPNCANVTVQVDAHRTAGQFGCAVYGNDQGTYRALIVPRACFLRDSIQINPNVPKFPKP